MWRALFLAIGISACVLGAECLVVHKAIFTRSAEASAPMIINQIMPAMQARREFAPPDWAPWSLLAGGAVVLLYSFTLPGRLG